jgi:spore germination protein GerM
VTRAGRWRPGRRAAGVGALAAAVALAGACGVPTDGSPREISADELPPGLVDAPSTTAPSSPGGDAEVVQLYYVADDSLVPAFGEVARPARVDVVLRALLEGPDPAYVARGYRSALPQGEELVPAADQRAGVARVELAPTFREIPAADQVLAVGQIVLTLTARPGVGQVRFLLDGQPVAVPRADGSVTAQPVSRDDYAALRADA